MAGETGAWGHDETRRLAERAPRREGESPVTWAPCGILGRSSVQQEGEHGEIQLSGLTGSGGVLENVCGSLVQTQFKLWVRTRSYGRDVEAGG